MRRLKRPGILIAYLALTLGMTYPLVRYLTSSLPGDGFDGWQNYWNLWWVRHALVDLGMNPFFCPLMDYPAGASLLFHTLNIFNVWTLPIQLLVGTVAAYNAVVLFSFAVSGLGGYLLARHVVRGRSALAGLGGGADLHFLAVPLRPPAGPHAGLLDGMAAVLRPVPAQGDRRPQDRRLRSFRNFGSLKLGDLKNVFLAALFLAFASLCDWYNLLYALLFTGLLFLWLVVRRRVTWGRLAGMAAIGVLGFVLLSPYLGPMILDASHSSYMLPGEKDAYQYSADLLAFVAPNEMHPLWGPQMREWGDHLTTTISERLIFAGYVPLLLAGYALWRAWRKKSDFRRSPGVYAGSPGDFRSLGNSASLAAGPVFWTLTTLFFAILALGPVLHVGGRLWPAPGGLPLPYQWLVNWVPFMKISRSVSRFDAMVMLALGVCAAFGLAALVPRVRRWRPPRSGRPGPGGHRADLLRVPAGAVSNDAARHADFYRTLAADPQQYAILPVPLDWDRPQYLLYQTVHGKPLTSAYTSRGNPRSWVDWTPLLMNLRRPAGHYVIDADPAAVGLSVLQAAGVRYVIVDRYQVPDEEQRAWNVDLISRVFGGLPPTLDDGRLIVYDAWEPRFQALTQKAAAFPRLAEDWSGSWVSVDGEPACWLKERGRIVIHSPTARAATVEMRFFDGGEGPLTIHVAGPQGELAAGPIAHYGYTDLRIPLDLPAGDVTLTVTADPSVVLPHGFSALELHRLSVK